MGAKFQKIISVLFLAVGIAAHASPEYDRVYQLETLGWLPAHDNADGIFADYLDEQYSRYFKKQSRFVTKKLNRLQEVLGKSSVSYPELIQKPEILKKVAQKYKVECLLRSKVYKEADTYRFALEFVFAPRGDVLASTEFRYTDPHQDRGLEGSELPEAIQKGLDDLISKLPFLGQVTGVQNDIVTVNLGRNQNIKPRDVLGIYTLQNLKRHPILNTIEEWRWLPVGRVQVDQVEESIAFGHILELDPGQSIIQFNKVRDVSTPPVVEQKPETSVPEENDIPRLGWIAGNVGYGTYTREVGLGAGGGRTGRSVMPHFELEGQLWLNSRWLSQLALSAGFADYKPRDIDTALPTGPQYSVSSNQFRLAVGYALLPARTILSTNAWVHMGYRATNFSMPSGNFDYTGASSFGSVFFGFGGEIPVYDKFFAQVGLDIGLLRSASQTFPDFGDVASSTDLMVTAAAAYRLFERISVRVVFKIDSLSMDFLSGETVSQKMFSVSPSVLYYF